MLRDIKEMLIKFVSHRLFALSVLFLLFFSILIYRIFNLQIINGQKHLDHFIQMTKQTITTNGQRGNIYDSEGNLLAYNKLTYSLTFSSSKTVEERAQKENKSEDEITNKIIHSMLQILDANGDEIVNNFLIKINKKGEFAYTTKSKDSINLFKREVYCLKAKEKLSDEQKNATAKDDFEFLKHGKGNNKMFDVSDEYSDKDALEIVIVRYNLFMNRFNQYLPVTVAMDISEKSVAAFEEKNTEFPGASIQNDSMRVYNDSQYFSQILGYTGVISQDEKEELNKTLKEEQQYTGNEIIGKTGLEKELESKLKGTNGKKNVLVDNVGRILRTLDEEQTKATSGNDVYLSINGDLQKKCYDTLEAHIAGIILANMTSQLDVNVKHTSDVCVPIGDVYFALYNNNLISLDKLKSKNASNTESDVYDKIKNGKSKALSSIKTEFNSSLTKQEDLSKAKQAYMSYIYNMLFDKSVMTRSDIDSNDEVLKLWKKDKTALGKFLKHAIKKNWVDISKFNVSNDYYDTEEVYDMLVGYINDELKNDDDFTKLVIKYMIKGGDISGYESCKILYDQDVLDKKKDKSDYEALTNGNLSAYSFMYKKIKSLEITPSQLALDLSSGSIVVTDVKTGKVKAMASYPSYDNNKLANNLDADYYAELLDDKSTPLINRAMQQRTAPGSTYKLCSAAAGLTEGVIDRYSLIKDTGVFTKVVPSPHCWYYPGKHGKINVTKAIEVSCNVFFYEVGYRLSKEGDDYNETRGLSSLKKYASLFGLNEASGIELPEAEPKISDTDAVRSAIGQADNAFTPTQISRYVTAVANSGKVFDLSILDKVKNNEGEVVKKYKSKVKNEIDLDSSTWDAIHQGMYQVVHGKEHGKIFKKMKTEVAGKTGTAQENEKKANHALFVSYAPFDNPEISITVVIPYGFSSSNAMDVAKDIYSYYYKEDKKSKKDKKDSKLEAIMPSSSGSSTD